jgi:hypothetical protein
MGIRRALPAFFAREWMSIPLVTLLALALYAAGCISAVGASAMAISRGRTRAEWVTWVLAVLTMSAVFLIRLYDLEDLARDLVREHLVASGAYADRWSFQAPVAAAIVLVSAGCAWLALLSVQNFRRRSRTQLLLLAGRFGMLGFVPLFAVRIVSLHMTDQLLYAGPVRLNWVLDLGLTLMVGGSAAVYVLLLVSRRPARAVR